MEILRGCVSKHQVILPTISRGPKANILVDNNGHACVSDFSLLTVAPELQTLLSPTKVCGGTAPWMSPELLSPEDFGLEEGCLTKESDIYALGMVIYEVFSGLVPFYPSKAPRIFRRVLDGERPERPQGIQGEWFTDDIWEMVTLCWGHQPSSRPGLDYVLRSLQDVKQSSRPVSRASGSVIAAADDRSGPTQMLDDQFRAPAEANTPPHFVTFFQNHSGLAEVTHRLPEATPVPAVYSQPDTTPAENCFGMFSPSSPKHQAHL